jgi:hypothetical protein
LRIGELRAKAQRARDLADLSRDKQAVVNLRSYARELDAEALELETELDAKPASTFSGPGTTNQDDILDTESRPSKTIMSPKRPSKRS